MGRPGVIVGGGSGFRNRTCIFCLKLYNKVLSRHSLLVTAQVDFRGDLMGERMHELQG